MLVSKITFDYFKFNINLFLFLTTKSSFLGSNDSMKITAIEPLICHARMRNWIFVKVVTDQPGLHGWGEATLEWHTRGVVGAIEDLLTELRSAANGRTRQQLHWQSPTSWSAQSRDARRQCDELHRKPKHELELLPLRFE